jgi:hypothetical protein
LVFLVELGGVATTAEIRKRAREKYPNFSLWKYVNDRLVKLKQRGDIAFDTKTGKYFIVVQQWPEAAESLSQS